LSDFAQIYVSSPPGVVGGNTIVPWDAGKALPVAAR
jgi:hypothetical protein